MAEFCTKPWTQTVPEAQQSPPDLIGDEVSEPESELSDSVPEGCSPAATWPLGSIVCEMSWMATRVWGAVSFLLMVLITKCPYFGT